MPDPAHAANLTLARGVILHLRAAVARACADPQALAALLAEHGLDPADVLTTPDDCAKLFNDRAVNQQIADHLGVGLGGPTLNAVTKIAAYGVTKVKELLRGGRAAEKGFAAGDPGAVAAFWHEMLREVFAAAGVPGAAPAEEAVAAWLADADEHGAADDAPAG